MFFPGTLTQNNDNTCFSLKFDIASSGPLQFYCETRRTTTFAIHFLDLKTCVVAMYQYLMYYQVNFYE